MRRSHDEFLLMIARRATTEAFAKYGFTVEAVAYAIECAVAELEYRTPGHDAEDIEALVEKVINIGLTT